MEDFARDQIQDGGGDRDGGADPAAGQGSRPAVPAPDRDAAARIRWSLMPVRDLQPRGQGESTVADLDVLHVLALAEAIAADGLRQPLVVDHAGTVLDGGHRLAALMLLSVTHDDARVRVFLDGLGLDPDVWPDGPLERLVMRVHQLRAHAFFDRYWDGVIPVIRIDDRPGDDLAALLRLAAAGSRDEQRGRVDRAFIAGGFTARGAAAAEPGAR